MKKIRYVAGLDASYSNSTIFGSAAVLEVPSLKLTEFAMSKLKCRYSYVPGKLFNREGKALLSAFKKIKTKVNLLCVDGNGTLHPEKHGIASEIGKRLGVPAIGCAKNRLLGSHESLDFNRGSYSWVYHEGEVLGAALRTVKGVKPVYVSAGYRISLEKAIKVTLEISRHRIPEPIREAHRMATEFRNKIDKYRV